jgi:hypothetical protein
MDYLTKVDLLFLLEELENRRQRKLKIIKKYHNSKKGQTALKRATQKYYSKIKTQIFTCTLCNKSVKMPCRYSHLRSKKHVHLLSNST